jgi:hypothetical protein
MKEKYSYTLNNDVRRFTFFFKETNILWRGELIPSLWVSLIAICPCNRLGNCVFRNSA